MSNVTAKWGRDICFIIAMDSAPNFTYYNYCKMKKILEYKGDFLYSHHYELHCSAINFIEQYNKKDTFKKVKKPNRVTKLK